MEIVEIKDKQPWNAFLLAQPTQAGIFLQSSEWLDFQEHLGRKVWRLGVEGDEGKSLFGVCGFIRHNLPFGKSYLYSPRGPVADSALRITTYHEFFESIRKQVQQIAGGERSFFWRFEPLANLAMLPRGVGGYGTETTPEAAALHTRRGRYLIAHSRKTLPVQPHQTLLLDITLNESALLGGMHEKTRYNLRLAAKKGVEVRNVECRMENVELLLNLLQETAKRDKFKPHPRKYYEKMLETLGKGTLEEGNNETMVVRLWLAYYENEPVAGAIVGYFGDTATYLHGASSYKCRALMAPNLLHWEIMRQAKAQGYKWYDFWGIDEKKWPGLTRFKKGFTSVASPDRSVGSGRIINYPGTFDLILSPFWYSLYRLGRRVL